MQTAVSWPVFLTFITRQIRLPQSGGWSYAGKELNDFIVDDGAQFLILHLKITNITNEILVMYKDDFMITYDQDGPYEAENNFGVRNQFPDEYALKPQESKSGKLIFIISSSANKIMMTYTEYFDDESEGKTYKLKYKIK